MAAALAAWHWVHYKLTIETEKAGGMGMSFIRCKWNVAFLTTWRTDTFAGIVWHGDTSE
jgi:hypothetical protein